MKRMASAVSRLAGALALTVAAAVPLSARAEVSVVIDVATGKVLSEKNASARWYPASTTKLMTAFLALKAMERRDAALDTPVVMTRYAATQAPSKMGFEPGSVMRLDMALRMMLVKSANDVAVAIGQSLAGGNLQNFVDAMNREAQALGMKDTHFINPNGLPGPGQHSSAKDLGILAMHIRRDFPAFSEIFGVEAIEAGGTLIRNTNPLLGRYDGADGMKTGYICASGFNLVASATRNKRTIVAVVLGAEGPIVRDRITAELLENAFKTDTAKLGTQIEQLPVAEGPTADISGEICSPAGQKARAEEREAEAKREHTSGSPYLHEMDRPPAIVEVSLGGAAASDTVEAGISQIAAYGIPLPHWRPDDTGASGQPKVDKTAKGDGSEQVADGKGGRLGGEPRVLDQAEALRGGVAN